MQPKVSVIVPIYNAEKYLAECIESVITQTLQEIELILIDDESTDKSLYICNQYSKKDKRIKVYSNKNVGQGIERSYGISKAMGEYIAFLDADDVYMPKMLEKMYLLAVKEQADMVSCGYMDICPGRVIEEHSLDPMVVEGRRKICTIMSDLIANENADGYKGCIAVWDSIFKKETIEKNQIQFFSERIVYSEDLLFKLHFMSCSNKIVFCKDLLYKYRITETSFTNEISTAILERILKLHDTIIEEFSSFLKEYNLETRITNRTFFTLRFNIRKAAQSTNAKEFYQCLCENKRIQQILKNYKASTIKNKLVLILLKIRNPVLMQWILTKIMK